MESFSRAAFGWCGLPIVAVDGRTVTFVEELVPFLVVEFEALAGVEKPADWNDNPICAIIHCPIVSSV